MTQFEAMRSKEMFSGAIRCDPIRSIQIIVILSDGAIGCNLKWCELKWSDPIWSEVMRSEAIWCDLMWSDPIRKDPNLSYWCNPKQSKAPYEYYDKCRDYFKYEIYANFERVISGTLLSISISAFWADLVIRGHCFMLQKSLAPSFGLESSM